MSEQFPEYTEAVGACKACGNSPVNHFAAKATSTVDVFTGTLSKYLRDAGWVGRKNIVRSPGRRIEHMYFELMHMLGVISYGHDIECAKSYRSRVVWEEAIRRSIPMEQVIIFGAPTDMYRAKVDTGWIYFESLPVPPEFERGSTEWVGDKVLLKRALQKHGIPVPLFKSVRSFAQAESFFAAVHGPVIVKPRVGTRGRHTTVGVHTVEELKKAITSAKVLCAYASVEEELQGSVCRGTVINHRLVGFFQADPPIVVGDGHSTLQELIDQANASREERIAEIILTDENLEYLKRLGYSLENVPAQGNQVRIGHRTGRLFGGKTAELLDSVHPRLKQYLEEATTFLDIPVIGFDLIIQDPKSDPDKQKWGIIEANTLPFIDLHYLPLYGTPSNPAAALWDMWKK